MYFEPVLQHIYNALAYLKYHKKLYANISIAKGISGEEVFRFSDIVEIRGENESIDEKIDATEMSEGINDTLQQNMLQLSN